MLLMRQSVGPRSMVTSVAVLMLYAMLLSSCQAWCPPSAAHRHIPALVPRAVGVHSEDAIDSLAPLQHLKDSWGATTLEAEVPVTTATLGTAEVSTTTDAFVLRPARFGDLGAVSALLVHSFFGNDNKWFVPMCMTEMSRLQDNFPRPPDSSDGSEVATATEPAAEAAIAETRFFNALSSDTASFFGFGAEAEASTAAPPPRPGFQAYLVAERTATNDEEEANANASDAVATAASRMVGFAQLDFRLPAVQQRDDAPRPYMSDLAVCCTARRQGLARALVERCEALVRSEVRAQRLSAAQEKNTELPRGTRAAESALARLLPKQAPASSSPPSGIECKLWLKADRSNLAAMKLYRSMGYKVVKEYEESERLLLCRELEYDEQECESNGLNAFIDSSESASVSIDQAPMSKQKNPIGFVVTQ